jgi:hypothetical protein
METTAYARNIILRYRHTSSLSGIWEQLITAFADSRHLWYRR